MISGGAAAEPVRRGDPPGPQDDQQAPRDDTHASRDNSHAPKGDSHAPRDDSPAPRSAALDGPRSAPGMPRPPGVPGEGPP